MPPAGFKPAVPSSERPQTHAFNHPATAIGLHTFTSVNHTNIPRTQRVFVRSLLNSHNAVKQRDVPDFMSCIFQLFIPLTARDFVCVSALIIRLEISPGNTTLCINRPIYLTSLLCHISCNYFLRSTIFVKKIFDKICFDFLNKRF